ncbi:MAG: DinB family protein [Blastocatellia bacterium]
MPSALDQQQMLLAAWRTNNRVTSFLVEHLPDELWGANVPGAPRRTVRMIAGHIHNSRCMWIRTLGNEHGIAVPRPVNRYKVAPKELLPALRLSSRGIISLLTLGFERGGAIPGSSSYTWRNLPLDVGHVLTYFVAHEGHHRGQIVMLARQLGYRLPAEITGGLWNWSKRAREALS